MKWRYIIYVLILSAVICVKCKKEREKKYRIGGTNGMGSIESVVEDLSRLSSNQTPKSVIRNLLITVQNRFPTYSYRKLGDMVYKTKKLCANNGHHVSTITPLFALKNITDGWTEKEFRIKFTNNGPPELLTTWLITGCK